MERLPHPTSRSLLKAAVFVLGTAVLSHLTATPTNADKIYSPDFNLMCEKTGKKWEGQASYYSTKKCQGCSDPPIMYNGELLNDAIPTIAGHPDMPLNSFVRVINKVNELKTIAKVTDRGSFHLEPWKRIADLGLKVKNAIRGEDLTDVRIKQVRCESVRAALVYGVGF